MSFSREVKEELGRQTGKSRHCQIAELAAIFLMNGRVEENPPALTLDTDNLILKEKYHRLLRMAFDLREGKRVEGEDARRVLGALKLLAEDAGGGIQMEDVEKENAVDGIQLGTVAEEEVRGGGGIQNLLDTRRCNGLLLQKTCCRRAYLRGAFLAAGSISDPRKAYHFEIVCRSVAQAVQLRELMDTFDLDAKIVERKRHQVVYLKEGSQIVDMLNVMEAYVALMNLENVRIIKEMRNSVNRKVNCETANINKTVNAAVRQAEEIMLIRDRMGLEKLPENLRQMALLRLEHPELPLKELGGMLEPPVGKSGVNHRLRKLSEIAEKLR